MPVKDSPSKDSDTAFVLNKHGIRLIAHREFEAVMEEAEECYKIVWHGRIKGIACSSYEEELDALIKKAAVWKELTEYDSEKTFTQDEFMGITKEIEPSKDSMNSIKTKLSKLYKGNSHLVMINGKDIEPKSVEWVIEHMIASNVINLLAGVAKQGKTTLALNFAALVTRGGVLANKYQCKPGKVLIYSGEDDIHCIIAPRLEAAGADMGKIEFISHRVNVFQDEILEEPFYLDKNLAMLDEALSRDRDIRMLILDPIVGIAAGARDSNNPIHIRKALQPLIALTQKHGIATLGITHFKKGGQGSVLDRVVGSQAWTAVARVILVVDFLKIENTYMLCRAHCNLDSPIDNIAYRLTSTDEGIVKVEFGQHMPGGVDMLEAQNNFEDPERRAALKEASDFLFDYLENAPGNSDEWQNIVKASKQDSLSESTLRRARSHLVNQGEIESKRVEGQRGGRTLWSSIAKEQPVNKHE